MFISQEEDLIEAAKSSKKAKDKKKKMAADALTAAFAALDVNPETEEAERDASQAALRDSNGAVEAEIPQGVAYLCIANSFSSLWKQYNEVLPSMQWLLIS